MGVLQSSSLRISLLILLCVGEIFAQDVIAFKIRPDVNTSIDIADQMLFYQEDQADSLRFDEVRHLKFIPYTKELRGQKSSHRPEVIQWFKFIVTNTSDHDTLDLMLDMAPHYYTWLYQDNVLVAKGGAYYPIRKGNDRFGLPVKLSPSDTVTYWLKTYDRLRQLTPQNFYLKTPYAYTLAAFNFTYASRYLFLFLALTTGCLLFITLFAAYQYYLTRDNSTLRYMFYGAFAFFTGLFWMDIRHQLSLFNPFIREVIYSSFLYLIPVLYSLFVGSVLELHLHFRRAWKFVMILIAIAIFQASLDVVEIRTGWLPFDDRLFYIFKSIVPVFLLHVTLLILTLKSKSPIRKYILGGLMSLVILLCLPMLGLYSYYSYAVEEIVLIFNFVPALFLFGLMIEAICFSFALADRNKLVVLEKNQMQDRYALQLEDELTKRTQELAAQHVNAEAQKIKQIQTEFEQKIAETEMTALRAQMNPHFIFNCLNSIKLYTLENDSKTASEYLTIFSQLIRLVLENSRSEKVTLQKELETLRLYVELEAMRFKNKVRYQIIVDPDIDQQYIEIPPLLLQPYVENAIWHGLMHKKTGGCITIHVASRDEHLLHIEIIDDGIGRELAAQYKSKSATRQKSFGLKMTSERIDIMNQIHSMQADVHIDDLKDVDNNSLGTKVTIEIPV